MDQPLVRWRLIYACSPGTSHIEKSIPCQDSICCATTEASGGEVLAIALADGAGSAAYSDQGAERACTSLCQLMTEWIVSTGGSTPPTAVEMAEWVNEVHDVLLRLAESQGHAIRDFACTLLGAVCGRSWAAFLQIGDGAIVIRDADVLAPIFWPDGGEYANQTHFVTDPTFRSFLMTSLRESPVAQIAVMSDGLQRLALNFATKGAHPAFFEPLFRALASKPFEQVQDLEGSLEKLLQSEAVNLRTDDDKSLVLASLGPS